MCTIVEILHVEFMLNYNLGFAEYHQCVSPLYISYYAAVVFQAFYAAIRRQAGPNLNYHKT